MFQSTFDILIHFTVRSVSQEAFRQQEIIDLEARTLDGIGLINPSKISVYRH